MALIFRPGLVYMLFKIDSLEQQRNMAQEDWGGYEEELIDLSEPMPRILLMGSSRSGKSSMSGVVFSKMPPHETMFMDELGAGLDIKHVANNAFVQFQVWDFPGNFDCTTDELLYGGKAVTLEQAFGGEGVCLV